MLRSKREMSIITHEDEGSSPAFSDRLKNASPSKQEQARLDVENAEDDLVQKTEVAITLMKTVLESVRT
jgi:hypothetical protein